MDAGEPNACSYSALVLLGGIRGSFALFLYYAVLAYKSPSLTFLLRSPLTLLLYIGSLLILRRKEPEQAAVVSEQLKSFGVYWRTAVMGLIQLAVPYMCYMYSLLYLPVTLAGTFMASTLWFTFLLDRMPFLKPNSPAKMTKYKIYSMLLGLLGVTCVCISDMFYVHDKSCPMATTKNNSLSVNSTMDPIAGPCREAKIHLYVSFVALLCGTLSWSICSVFWRMCKGEVHLLVSGTLNNLFASVLALVLWLALRRFEESNKVSWDNVLGLVSVLFLSIASGWLAAIILYYSYQQLGSRTTNRVVVIIPVISFIEDRAFVRNSLEDIKTWTFALELVGVLVTMIALVLFGFQPKKEPLTLLDENLIQDEDSIVPEDDARRYRQESFQTEASGTPGYVPFMDGQENNNYR